MPGASYLWVEVNSWCWTDEYGTKRSEIGVLTGESGCVDAAGNYGVKLKKWHYVDTSGNERAVEGVAECPTYHSVHDNEDNATHYPADDANLFDTYNDGEDSGVLVGDNASANPTNYPSDLDTNNSDYCGAHNTSDDSTQYPSNEIGDEVGVLVGANSTVNSTNYPSDLGANNSGYCGTHYTGDDGVHHTTDYPTFYPEHLESDYPTDNPTYQGVVYVTDYGTFYPTYMEAYYPTDYPGFLGAYYLEDYGTFFPGGF